MVNRVMGPILTAYDHFQYLTLRKFVLPLINARIGQLSQTDEKLPLYDEKKPVRNSFLSDPALSPSPPLLLSLSLSPPAHTLNYPAERLLPVGRSTTPSHIGIPWSSLTQVIARRLACLCFAAIQSSVISITNTLHDIASSPQCFQYLTAMRRGSPRRGALHCLEPHLQATAGCTEPVPGTQAKLPTAPSPWGKAALARMVHVDSALRESMRLNGFVARGIMKMVTARSGVTLPDGSHIPYGTKVGIQAYNVHRDSEYYPDAETYDAFRFVDPVSDKPRVRMMVPPRGSDDETTKNAGQLRNKREGREPKALVSTSPTFLAFSHGPNSWCVTRSRR